MEIKNIEFTNWSGQYKSKPSVYVIPVTAADLQMIIKDNENFPSPLVAIGSGHSNSGCNIVNGGTAVYMKKFNRIYEPLSDEITAGAGTELIEIHRYLAARKMQLPFTPEIGNATLGSLACCCLKDAALGQSSGIATGMVRAIRYIDALGNDRTLKRGDPDWAFITSSHGLFGIIYEVSLDIMPMKLVIQNYVRCYADNTNFEQVYLQTLKDNDGIFGLLNASTGQFIFETRNYSLQNESPRWFEKTFNIADKNIFKYFNPIVGAIENNWYSRIIRRLAMAGFSLMKTTFPQGRRTYKCLKPIDYSYKYPYRWDFHFWAFPVSDFPTIVLPAFLKFLADYKQSHPGFDEKGLFACYRLRVENKAILSPTFSEERMTLDPVRPVTENLRLMEAWDHFCFAYNDFAVKLGGKCTFNQTKMLTKTQVELAFGIAWTEFKQARDQADLNQRFLSEYFRKLIGG